MRSRLASFPVASRAHSRLVPNRVSCPFASRAQSRLLPSRVLCPFASRAPSRFRSVARTYEQAGNVRDHEVAALRGELAGGRGAAGDAAAVGGGGGGGAEAARAGRRRVVDLGLGAGHRGVHGWRARGLEEGSRVGERTGSRVKADDGVDAASSTKSRRNSLLGRLPCLSLPVAFNGAFNGAFNRNGGGDVNTTTGGAALCSMRSSTLLW